MSPKHHLLLFALLAGVVIFCLFFLPVQTLQTYTYASNSTIDKYQISQIKKNNSLPLQNLVVEGYVVKIYNCPPCPVGAVCKPCMEDNIVISDQRKLLETYKLTENEMIIFAKNITQFKLGKKYRFLVKILTTRSTTEPINDIVLIDYELTS